jgi:hypothetical protein
VTERISTLPEPQANALNGALGTSSDVADRFLIGVAVLTLVGELAKERPARPAPSCVESGQLISRYRRCAPLVLDGGEHFQRGASALPVVEDLQVLEQGEVKGADG